VLRGGFRDNGRRRRRRSRWMGGCKRFAVFRRRRRGWGRFNIIDIKKLGR
jgi:hypothetical protein